MLKRLLKNRRGAALVEYGLLIGGIALISAGAVSLFGHKTSDIIGTVAAILPGAHTDDNGPIISGKLIETTNSATGFSSGTATTGIALDFAGIAASGSTRSLGLNVGGTGVTNGVDGLVLEARP